MAKIMEAQIHVLASRCLNLVIAALTVEDSAHRDLLRHKTPRIVRLLLKIGQNSSFPVGLRDDVAYTCTFMLVTLIHGTRFQSDVE